MYVYFICSPHFSFLSHYLVGFPLVTSSLSYGWYMGDVIYQIKLTQGMNNSHDDWLCKMMIMPHGVV